MVFSVDLESCQYVAYHNFSIYPFLYLRRISVIFPVEFPPYITMVWYLFLVKGGIIQHFVSFLDGEMKLTIVKYDGLCVVQEGS